MIRDLARILEEDERILCGNPVDPLYLTDCKQYLAETGKGDLPSAYSTLLRYVNGAYGDEVSLFGVLPDGGAGLKDIVVQNEAYSLEDNNLLLIGENVSEWLVYDNAKALYCVVDKQDLSEVNSFIDFEDAVAFWFDLEM